LGLASTSAASASASNVNSAHPNRDRDSDVEDDDDDEYDDDSDGDEDQGGSASKATLVAAALADAKRRFAHRAFALYWLGGACEEFTGEVALADSAGTAVAAPPVVFDIWGDGAVLWSSSNPLTGPTPRVPAVPFSVSVLGVSALALVVRCAGTSNAGAHALWVNPSVTTAAEWVCGGWRNAASAQRCALCGIRRGRVPAVPAPIQLLRDAHLVSEQLDANQAVNNAKLKPGLWTSPLSLAAGVLGYAALLAQEYMRGMRSPSPKKAVRSLLEGGTGTAPFVEEVGLDLDAPFAIQVSAENISSMVSIIGELQPLLERARKQGESTAAAESLISSILRIASANIRRVIVSGASPAEQTVGLCLTTSAAPDACGRVHMLPAPPMAQLLQVCTRLEITLCRLLVNFVVCAGHDGSCRMGRGIHWEIARGQSTYSVYRSYLVHAAHTEEPRACQYFELAKLCVGVACHWPNTLHSLPREAR
jgi:hypothetical protein